MNLEQSIFETLHSLTNQSKVLDWFIIFFGTYLPYVLLLAAIWFTLRSKEWPARFYRFAFVVLTIILSRGVLTEIIRFFYDRPRPFAVMNFMPLINHNAAYSFPSGHAALYFALALALFAFNWKWGSWFFLGAVLIGAARVIAGAHWPLDIAGGLLVSLLSVFVVKWLLPRTLIIK
jgi:undecaprenyl-diphosphatase